MKNEIDYDFIFDIAKDVNENYPDFMEDLGVKHKVVDKGKIIFSIEKCSDFKLETEDGATLVNSNKDNISYDEFENRIYNMVYHQICNLNI